MRGTPSPFSDARISFWLNQDLLYEFPLLASKLDTCRFTADSFDSLVLREGLPNKNQIVMAIVNTLASQLQHIALADAVNRLLQYNVAIIICKYLRGALEKCIDQSLSKLFIEMSEYRKGAIVKGNGTSSVNKPAQHF